MAFQRVYSDSQREAVVQAWCDRAVRPAATVVRLAAAGELQLDGTPLEPFTLTVASAKRIGEREQRRRERTVHRAESERPADAVERYRRRLSGIIDEQLDAIERLQRTKHHARVKAPELQALARAVREVAAIPTREESSRDKPRPPRRSYRPDDASLGAQLRATLGPSAPVQHDLHHEQSEGNEDGREGAHASENGNNDDDVNGNMDRDQETTDPGTYIRQQISGLRGSVSSVKRAR